MRGCVIIRFGTARREEIWQPGLSKVLKCQANLSHVGSLSRPRMRLRHVPNKKDVSIWRVTVTEVMGEWQGGGFLSRMQVLVSVCIKFVLPFGGKSVSFSSLSGVQMKTHYFERSFTSFDWLLLHPSGTGNDMQCNWSEMY